MPYALTYVGEHDATIDGSIYTFFLIKELCHDRRKSKHRIIANISK